ncbi:MAG: bifunctional ornithine acetyltransferase/N-acetylglutamate synthase, partial [Terriglobales bacterium]
VFHGAGFTVGGMAKGSGMIHPNLATMLAVVTTDYPLEPGEAIDFLRPAVDASFNSISVDGECSTNDAVVLLASGEAAIERTPATDAELALAIRTVCAELAQQVVADGEGATLLAEIAVSGAASAPEARAIAQRIATSSLVKTALFGRDANWGRVLAAAGYSGARFSPDRAEIWFSGLPVYRRGVALAFDEAEAKARLDRAEVTVRIHMHAGKAATWMWTCDLTEGYVKVNGSYRT